MGACACGSVSGANEATQAIDKHLKDVAKSEKGSHKLLLLGSGSSGKSTLFRHWSLVLKTGFFENNHSNEDIAITIRQNCLLGMLKLLEKTSQIHEFNKSQYETEQYGLDPNYGNKPFYVNIHSLRDVKQKNFAKFARNLYIVVKRYLKKKLKGQNVSYSNKKSKSIWIPDPALWNQSLFTESLNDPDSLTLNPFVVKSLIEHKKINNLNNDFHRISKIIELSNNSNKKSNEATLSLPEAVGTQGKRDRSASEDITSMTFDIARNPETFIEISLNILKQDNVNLIEELMYECLQRKRLLLREEYFRRQSTKMEKMEQCYDHLLDHESHMAQMEPFLEQMRFTMIEQSVLFYYSLNEMISLPIDDFRSYIDSASNNNEEQTEKLNKVKESLKLLWESDQVRQTFKKRHRHKYSLADNIDYFYGKMDAIFDINYANVITNEDIVKCRIRTSGMTIQQIECQGVLLDLIDVGGQRSERRKWVHYFDGVSGVTFVAALNHYASVLFEDESENAMIESIKLFGYIVNTKWFRKTPILLFFNKDDLFQKCILGDIALSNCFSPENGCVSNSAFDDTNENSHGDIFNVLNNMNNTSEKSIVSKFQNVSHETKKSQSSNLRLPEIELKDSSWNNDENKENDRDSKKKEKERQDSMDSLIVNVSGQFSKECEVNVFPWPELRYSNKAKYNNGEFKKSSNQEWFEIIYINYLQFIAQQYMNQSENVSPENIFVHITNATNAHNIEKLFWDVQNVVVRKNLRKGGLMSTAESHHIGGHYERHITVSRYNLIQLKLDESDAYGSRGLNLVNEKEDYQGQLELNEWLKENKLIYLKDAFEQLEYTLDTVAGLASEDIILIFNDLDITQKGLKQGKFRESLKKLRAARNTQDAKLDEPSKKQLRKQKQRQSKRVSHASTASTISGMGESFEVTNPLIVMLGIGEYDDGLDDLVGISKDYENSIRVFSKHWGYHILYQTTNNNIIYESNIDVNNSLYNNYKLRWTGEEIETFVDYSRKILIDHRHNGLIFIVTSHGDIDKVIYDSELEKYELTDIYMAFTPVYAKLLNNEEKEEESNHLFGIPKIFAVDACRGNFMQKATRVNSVSKQKKENNDKNKKNNSGSENEDDSKETKDDEKEHVTPKSKNKHEKSKQKTKALELFTVKTLSKTEVSEVFAQPSNFCKVYATTEGCSVLDGSVNGGLFLRNVTKVFNDLNFVCNHSWSDIVLKIRSKTFQEATMINNLVNMTQVVEDVNTLTKDIRFYPSLKTIDDKGSKGRASVSSSALSSSNKTISNVNSSDIDMGLKDLQAIMEESISHFGDFMNLTMTISNLSNNDRIIVWIENEQNMDEEARGRIIDKLLQFDCKTSDDNDKTIEKNIKELIGQEKETGKENMNNKLNNNSMSKPGMNNDEYTIKQILPKQTCKFEKIWDYLFVTVINQTTNELIYLQKKCEQNKLYFIDNDLKGLLDFQPKCDEMHRLLQKSSTQHLSTQTFNKKVNNSNTNNTNNTTNNDNSDKDVKTQNEFERGLCDDCKNSIVNINGDNPYYYCHSCKIMLCCNCCEKRVKQALHN